jgi:hypothetical protein
MNDTHEQPKRKRRWLRLSLRAFFVLLTISCVWLGRYVYRAERQRSAVAWIVENNGSVSYAYQVDANGKFLPYAQDPVPSWMLNNLDISYFSSVHEVNLLYTDINLTPFAGLPNLKWLTLDQTKGSDLSPYHVFNRTLLVGFATARPLNGSSC